MGERIKTIEEMIAAGDVVGLSLAVERFDDEVMGGTSDLTEEESLLAIAYLQSKQTSLNELTVSHS